MRRIATALAAGVMLATTAAPALASPEEGREKLAKLLEGRVAGEPQDCIRTLPVTNFQIIDGTALVYKAGPILYVNVPQDPQYLDDRDGIQTRTFGTRLCNYDVVTTFDRHHGHYTGNLFLGDFVPYRKAR